MLSLSAFFLNIKSPVNLLSQSKCTKNTTNTKLHVLWKQFKSEHDKITKGEVVGDFTHSMAQFSKRRTARPVMLPLVTPVLPGRRRRRSREILSEIHLSAAQRSFTGLARTDAPSLRKVSRSYFQSNEDASAPRPPCDSAGL